MFKRIYQKSLFLVPFFLVFIAQGMDKQTNEVTVENNFFEGSSIYYSLSSSSEEESNERMQEFHMVEIENFDMIKTIVTNAKKSMVIVDDYKNLPSIPEKSPEATEVIIESGNAWQAYIDTVILQAESYLNASKDLKNNIFISRDTQQRH